MSVFTNIAARLLRLAAANPPRTREAARPGHDDEAVLLTNRWFPRGHDRSLPTLFMRSANGSTVMTLEPPLIAERGCNDCTCFGNQSSPKLVG